MRALLFIALGLATLRAAEARVNASGAVATFLISDCAECTADKNSIFCTEAADESNFVKNTTTTLTIRWKKARMGPSDGAKFCWEGTFGKLLRNEGGPFDGILGSDNITANLQCAQRQLFYRQCVIPSEMAIALIAVAAFLCVCSTTLGCFYCGCCKCLNNKEDESKWGMCNRFCPWMPCSDPPEKEAEVAKHLVNPLSEEENKSSLFGRNQSLNAMNRDSIAGVSLTGVPGTLPTTSNPLANLKKTPGANGFADLKKPKAAASV